MRSTTDHHERAAIAAAMAQGRFGAAIGALEARVRAAPRDPRPLAELGACLLASRRPHQALEAYRAALALAPDHAGLLCATAGALRGLGRSDEAAALYGAARARDPTSFDASFGLALLACETGEWGEVETLAREMKAAHGARPDLEWLAARAELAQDRAGPALARVERLLALSQLAPEQRAELLLMRSDALDRLDRPAEAFASAADGKLIQRRLYAERAAGREGQVERLRRLACWFETHDPSPWRIAPAREPAEGEPRAHAFILGFPRSGTTLLEQALAGRAEVATLEEAPTLAEAFAEFMTADADLDRLSRLDADEAALWRARYWNEVRARGVDPAGRVFVDKAPAETPSLPLIARLFPGAKVLFALRDPRDVVLSCLRQNFQMNALTWAFTDLAQTAACYDACMALAEVYRRILPLDLMEVRHEALVDDFAGQMRAVGDFLQLEGLHGPADPAAVARGRRVLTPSADQVRAGLNRRGLGRWRAYAPQLERVMPTLAPWVRRLGYEPA